MKISQQRLKSVVSYERETGLFRWKISTGGSTKGDVAGSKSLRGYIYIQIDGKMLQAHRLAWLYMYGNVPDLIDHINGNGLDNRASNLRSCNKYENSWNTRIRKDNKSGVKGVSWSKRASKWQAMISVNGVKKYLGLFNDVESAESVIRKERERLHGEFSRHR